MTLDAFTLGQTVVHSAITGQHLHEGYEDAETLRHREGRGRVEYRTTQAAATARNGAMLSFGGMELHHGITSLTSHAADVGHVAKHTDDMIETGTEVGKEVAEHTGEGLELGGHSVSASMHAAEVALPVVGAGISMAFDLRSLAKSEKEIAKIDEQMKKTHPGTYEAARLASKQKALAKQSAIYSVGIAVDSIHMASTGLDLGIASGAVAAGLTLVKFGATKRTIATYKHELNDMVKSYEKYYIEKGLDPKEEYTRNCQEYSTFLKECEELNASCEKALQHLESLEETAARNPQANLNTEIQDAKNTLQNLILQLKGKADELPARRKKFLVVTQNYKGIQNAKHTIIDLHEDLQRYHKHQERVQHFEKAHPLVLQPGGLAVLENRIRKEISHAPNKAAKSQAQLELKELQEYRNSCKKLVKLGKELEEKVHSLKKEEANLQRAMQSLGKDTAKYQKAANKLEKTQRRLKRINDLLQGPEQVKRHAEQQKAMKAEKTQLERDIAGLEAEMGAVYQQMKEGRDHLVVDGIAVDHQLEDDIDAYIHEDADLPALDDDSIEIASYDEEALEPKAYIIEGEKTPRNSTVMKFLQDIKNFPAILSGIRRQLHGMPLDLNYMEQHTLRDFGFQLKDMRRVLWDLQDAITHRPHEFTAREAQDCQEIIRNYSHTISDLTGDISFRLSPPVHPQFYKMPSPPLRDYAQSADLRESITVEV